jgi:hypothetical protein
MQSTIHTGKMAESEIGSEYGVPQVECEVKQQKKEHDKRNNLDETDAEACIIAATSMNNVETEGIYGELTF